MVKRLKLNEKTVREAANLGRDYQIFDTDVRGFSVTIYPSGNRAFTLDYRVAGRQRRMTIGRWPEWTATAARERAKQLRREIDEGGDPLSQRQAAREAPRISDLIERYLAEHTPNFAPRSAADHHTIMHKLVGPDWNKKLVTEITKADVEKLLNKIAAGRARPSKVKPNNRARKLQGPKPTPVRANRVGEVLRKMFSLSIEWGMRTDNPASGFRRRIETERERFLSPEEIARLAKVLDAAEDQRAAGIIRLCMLTGARVGEVRQARFEQFNLDLLSWSKPASTTKQRKIHRIPISDDVAAIVRQRSLLVPRGNPWLFPGDTPGQPVKEIRRFWVGIQKKANLPGVRIHEAERRAYRIADNKLTELGEWDEALLRDEIAGLLAEDFDLTLLGISDDDLDALLRDPEALGGDAPVEGEDDVPELPVAPVSVPGDLWQLGAHRLICGDSTAADVVGRLLGDLRPLLMVTDPPYGVEYDPSWRNQAGAAKTKRTGKVLNDDRADWREAWALFPGDVAYVWHGALHAATVADSLAAAGFAIRSQIIWAKDRLVLSRGDYHWQHEPCWYAVRAKGKGHWAGDRKQTTLWQIANRDQDADTVHGTQKPVECMRRPILNNSSPGQAVYEPFMGSGTTLIAAETTGRVCFGVELNPAYVDVAVERWQSFTGLEAVLAETGETFAALKAKRLAA